MNFKDRLRELRTEKGLTQEGLGKIFNVIKQTVSSWENEGSKPDIDMASSLAEYFDVSTDYLLGRTDVRKYIPQDVAPREFFPPELAEEMEKYAEYITIFKEKKYTPSEIIEIGDLVRRLSKKEHGTN